MVLGVPGVAHPCLVSSGKYWRVLGKNPSDRMAPLEGCFPMNNIIGLAIFALGIVLLIFGFNESHSFGSDISRTFTGNPTDRSIWFIAGGAVTVVVGLVLCVRGMRKS
jgi:Protein of unknown function (DUF3185)